MFYLLNSNNLELCVVVSVGHVLALPEDEGMSKAVLHIKLNARAIGHR